MGKKGRKEGGKQEGREEGESLMKRRRHCQEGKKVLEKREEN
ncbi:hypothetical protein [Streptococcus pyogenes]|nr:hypothetical protein [Streptococcus pyogenes]